MTVKQTGSSTTTGTLKSSPPALKNPAIARANPGVIANEAFIHALFKEAQGRNATKSELARFANTTVKDSANIILKDRSPFADSVISRSAVLGAKSAEEALRVPARPAEPPVQKPAPPPADLSRVTPGRPKIAETAQATPAVVVSSTPPAPKAYVPTNASARPAAAPRAATSPQPSASQLKKERLSRLGLEILDRDGVLILHDNGSVSGVSGVYSGRDDTPAGIEEYRDVAKSISSNLNSVELARMGYDFSRGKGLSPSLKQFSRFLDNLETILNGKEHVKKQNDINRRLNEFIEKNRGATGTIPIPSDIPGFENYVIQDGRFMQKQTAEQEKEIKKGLEAGTLVEVAPGITVPKGSPAEKQLTQPAPAPTPPVQVPVYGDFLTLPSGQKIHPQDPNYATYAKQLGIEPPTQPVSEPMGPKSPLPPPANQGPVRPVLNNPAIAAANPGAIANEGFINALYQEAHGHDATARELGRWMDERTYVKDAAAVILGDRSPFLDSVIDRKAVPGARSAEAARLAPSTPTAKEIAAQKAEDERQKAEDQRRKKAAEQEAARKNALDQYARMFDAARSLGKSAERELKEERKQLQKIGVSDEAILAVEARATEGVPRAVPAGNLADEFDRNKDAAIQTLKAHLGEASLPKKSDILSQFTRAAEFLGRLDPDDLARTERQRKIEDLADYLHFYNVAKYAELRSILEKNDVAGEMKRASSDFQAAMGKFGAQNAALSKTWETKTPLLPGAERPFKDHADAATAAIGAFLGARVEGKNHQESARNAALATFENAARAAGRIHDQTERRSVEARLDFLQEQLRFYGMASLDDLGGTRDRGIKRGESEGFAIRAKQEAQRDDRAAGPVTFAKSPVSSDDVEFELEGFEKKIKAKEEAKTVERDRKELHRGFSELTLLVYQLDPNRRKNQISKMKDLAQRIDYEFEPFDTRKILKDPGDVNAARSEEIKSAREELSRYAWEEEAAKSRLSSLRRVTYDKIAALTEARPLSRRALQKIILGAPSPDGDLLDQLATIASQDLAPRISREDLVSDLLAEIDNPVRINQQGKGTCVPTTAQILLAKSDPVEYVRLISELAAPSGQARAAGGETLRRVDDWDDGSDKGFWGAVRSIPSRLLQPSLMKLWSPVYDNSDDGRWLGDVRLKAGFTSGGSASARMNRQLHGRDFENLDRSVSIGPGGLIDSLKSDSARASAKARDWAKVKKALDENKGPIPVGIHWEPRSAEHQVLVDRVKDGVVFYINPHGTAESMAESEFEDVMIAAQVPS